MVFVQIAEIVIICAAVRRTTSWW